MSRKRICIRCSWSPPTRGSSGLGSCFTSGKLVSRRHRVALAAAQGPIGRRAGAGHGDPAPVQLLARAGRHGRACDQRHRHRALGPDGQGLRPAGLAAAGRQLPRQRSSRMGRSCSTSRTAAADAEQRGRARVPGDQAGLAAVWPARPQVRRTAGPDGPRRPWASKSS